MKCCRVAQNTVYIAVYLNQPLHTDTSTVERSSMRVPPPHLLHCACVDSSSTPPRIHSQAECQCLCSRVGAWVSLSPFCSLFHAHHQILCNQIASLKPTHIEVKKGWPIGILFLLLCALDQLFYELDSSNVMWNQHLWGRLIGPTLDSDAIVFLTAILNFCLADLGLNK